MFQDLQKACSSEETVNSSLKGISEFELDIIYKSKSLKTDNITLLNLRDIYTFIFPWHAVLIALPANTNGATGALFSLMPASATEEVSPINREVINNKIILGTKITNARGTIV